MRSRYAIPLLGIAGLALGYFSNAAPNAAVTPADSQPARLDAALRRADPAESLAALRELAEKNPRDFFKKLDGFPAIEGVKELVVLAARKLAGEDPAAAAKLLNGINNMALREAAWLEFMRGISGGMLEKIKIARMAETSSGKVIYDGAVASVLEQDTEGTLKVLMEAKETKIHEWALSNLAKTDPRLVLDHVKQGLADGSMDRNTCAYVLEEMMNRSENQGTGYLKEIAGLVAEHGWQGGLDVDLIFLSAFDRATPEGRAAVMEDVLLLPAVRKNQVLSRLSLSSYAEPEARAMILNAMDSAELQAKALANWREDHATAEALAALRPLVTSEKTRAELDAMIGEAEK